MDRVRQWQPRNLVTGIYKPTGEPLRKAYACTLIEKIVAQHWPEADYISLGRWVEQAGDGSLFGGCASSPGASEADDSTKMDIAVNWALRFCVDRAFI